MGKPYAMPESSDVANFNPLSEPWGEIVFSTADDGYVWASWPGTVAAVKLGRYHSVLSMMQDFVGQSAVGERLAKRRAIDRELR